MSGKNRLGRSSRYQRRIVLALAALVTGVFAGTVPLSGAATRPPASTRAATSRSANPAAATTASATTASAATAASRPAIQADAILSKFPGNASVITARSDARNFTIEGRVREVQTVTLDANGIAMAGACPFFGGMKEFGAFDPHWRYRE